MPDVAEDRHTKLAAHRVDAELRATAALTDRPRLLAWYQPLVPVAQRYAVLREQQAAQLTLAWPALRRCAHHLGQHLVHAGVIAEPDEVFFCTRTELDAALAGQVRSLAPTVANRRDVWQRQRRLAAPLTLGRAPRLIGDVIDRAVRQARGPVDSQGLLVGHPASAGQATGPVRILTDPHDSAAFADGEVLVTAATTPAWTPLFARAAAVVTDGGTLAAHASLVAREYGIPAVVGTGDATRPLPQGPCAGCGATARPAGRRQRDHRHGHRARSDVTPTGQSGPTGDGRRDRLPTGRLPDTAARR
jgi:pyruvate,water dikinase